MAAEAKKFRFLALSIQDLFLGIFREYEEGYNIRFTKQYR
jgi:hypothetical protein